MKLITFIKTCNRQIRAEFQRLVSVSFCLLIREQLLVRLLGKLYYNQFRRDWLLCRDEPPHSYNQRWNAFEFTYGRNRSPYPFFRGFLVSEVIRTGDKLLDIGCGDGFFTNSFYSNRCRSIDAFDIEASAIASAKHLNFNDKITYRVLDAVHDAFPGSNYDVVVWDGAIGHFAQSDLSVVLAKISSALKLDGVFVGSESLGNEGTDHLQFFDDESSLARVFQPFFKYVAVRSIEYHINNGSYLRREAYFRCYNNSDSQTHRLTDSQTQDMASRLGTCSNEIINIPVMSSLEY